jgi:hypothetical protein
VGEDTMTRSYAAIIAPQVPLRSAPNSNAPQVDTLDFALVEYDDAGEVETTGWDRIKSPGRGAGYVEERFLQPELGYRVYLPKHSGHWRINAFLRGD